MEKLKEAGNGRAQQKTKQLIRERFTNRSR